MLIFYISSLFIIFLCHLSLSSFLIVTFMFYLWIGQFFADLLSEGLDSPLPSLYYQANTLANPDSLHLSFDQGSGQYWWPTKGWISITPLPSSYCWLTWWHIEGGYPSNLRHRASFPEYSMVYQRLFFVIELMIYWRWLLVIQPVIVVDWSTDNKADYHTREERWLRPINNSTSSLYTTTIEYDISTSGRFQIDT